jgi:(4S)-4-hydroxy-5-phosphonooxypentane-2,3-dione isomerase
MHSATLVHIRVNPTCRERFMEATRINRAASILEAGNLRFDFLQSAEDESLFFLYEVYETADAAKAHKETAHYLAWREAVAPMMSEARRGQPLTVLGI